MQSFFVSQQLLFVNFFGYQVPSRSKSFGYLRRVIPHPRYTLENNGCKISFDDRSSFFDCAGLCCFFAF
jgi:hypothetical protein